MFLNAVHGFCMALADSVPGVSGGTVAYVLGFYEKFINSIRTLLSADGLGIKKESFLYLCNLGVGWVIGMGLSVIALSALFEKNIYMMSSVFIGLTAAAIPFIIRSEREWLKGRYVNLFWTVLGAAVVIALTLFRGQNLHAGQVDLMETTPSLMIYLVISGAVAITAMVLPGISNFGIHHTPHNGRIPSGNHRTQGAFQRQSGGSSGHSLRGMRHRHRHGGSRKNHKSSVQALQNSGGVPYHRTSHRIVCCHSLRTDYSGNGKRCPQLRYAEYFGSCNRRIDTLCSRSSAEA